MPSLESVALKVALSATVEETAKVTFPVALEVPEAAPIVVLAGVEARLTVLPATGLPSTSIRVTVMVLVAVPFAVTLAGLAATLELLGETVPFANTIVTVEGRVRLLVVSVAVSFSEPKVDAVIGKVTCPAVLEGPDADPME
jgi:hypothetical protein